MDRLNLFAHFESKKEHHEDALTRALLVVLRLVPSAHSPFLRTIDRQRKARGPSLPSSDHVPLFQTQVGKIGCDAKRLLSILLTDSHFDQPVSVEITDRGARYDGVIAYPPDWVFVIENKPHHEHVWNKQLSPAFEKGCQIDVVESPAVVVPWQELITGIRKLLTSGEAIGASGELLRDFLDYLRQNFSFLNPYTEVGICGDDLALLDNRCRAILEEIAPGRVQYHRGWHHHIAFDHAVAQEIGLWANPSSAGWCIFLGIYPGDSMTQARRLYKHLNIAGLLKLAGKGWTIRPNFHLAHIQRNVLWTDTAMPIADYLAFWKRQQDQTAIAQVVIADAGLFSQMVDAWARLGLISNEDKEIIHAEFTHTNRKKVNVCPGLGVEFCWDSKAAADLDGRGLFANEVGSRIAEALATWEQHF